MPLKDQLKKKKTTQESNAYNGKLRSEPSANFHNGNSYRNDTSNLEAKPTSKPGATLTDSDWTQLLSTPNPPTTSAAANRGNGAPGIRGLRKGGRRQGSVGSNSSLTEVKRNQGGGGSVPKSGGRPVVEGNKLNGKASDADDSGFSDSAGRSSNVDVQSDGRHLEVREMDNKKAGIGPVVKPKDKDGEAADLKRSSQAITDSNTPETMSVLGKVDGVSEMKKQMGDARLKSSVTSKQETNIAPRSSTSDDLKRDFSATDGSFDSDSDSGSGSTSDSEVEREREERRRRREKILTEKAAAKAVEVIKERENMVARLEGEKQSLEKILEEQVKEQAQEVKLPALR